MFEAGKIYKLYDIPRNSWIRFAGEIMLFNKLDGGYSVCVRKGQVVHLAAWASVEYICEHEGFEHIEGEEFK